MNKEEMNHYETDNLSLCPYLDMEGLKYVGIKKDAIRRKFIFIFEDPKIQGVDLARAFLKSRDKEYKTYWSFYRNELSKAQQSGD